MWTSYYLHLHKSELLTFLKMKLNPPPVHRSLVFIYRQNICTPCTSNPAYMGEYQGYIFSFLNCFSMISSLFKGTDRGQIWKTFFPLHSTWISSPPPLFFPVHTSFLVWGLKWKIYIPEIVAIIIVQIILIKMMSEKNSLLSDKDWLSIKKADCWFFFINQSVSC